MSLDHEYYSDIKTVAAMCRGAVDINGTMEVLRDYLKYLFKNDQTLIQLQKIDQLSREVYDQLESTGKVDKKLFEKFGSVLFEAPEEGEDLYNNDWKKRP